MNSSQPGAPQGPQEGREPRVAHGLDQALEHMRWFLEPARFALLGFSEEPESEDLALLRGAGPMQIVRENGETTLLLREADLPAVLERHPGADVERELLWVRFELAMAWELVGFLALVTGRLAAAGVPLGAVCGYSRDHLFVAERYRETLVGVLTELFPGGAPGSPGAER